MKKNEEGVVSVTNNPPCKTIKGTNPQRERMQESGTNSRSLTTSVIHVNGVVIFSAARELSVVGQFLVVVSWGNTRGDNVVWVERPTAESPDTGWR